MSSAKSVSDTHLDVYKRQLQSRQPDCEILFIGAVGGMEETLVRREGFCLETLKISNFQRRLTPAAIGHNVKTAANIAGAMRRVQKIMRKFRPAVIVGTGGYASFPALKQGAKLHIPTAVHESNAVPGLTTRMVADRVDRIMVCFEESKACYANADRVRVVGMPDVYKRQVPWQLRAASMICSVAPTLG